MSILLQCGFEPFSLGSSQKGQHVAAQLLNTNIGLLCTDMLLSLLSAEL